jgi:adhesin/invasin
VVTGQDLEGSPVVFTATATSGGVSATESQVEAAPATISASSGSSAATITVRVRDQFGNPVAGVPVALAADGSGNTLAQPAEPTDANGIATGRLSATAVGTRTVTATAGGVELEQTATVTVQPGAPAAATSTATVPASGESGRPTTIEIQLRDAFGNPVPGRASAIVVAVAGANTVPGVTSSDQGGGLYGATYTPIVAGTDRVEVRVSGAPVAGSPFSSTVAPGPVSAAASTAVVNWNFFTVSAIVTARDAQGNPVGRGGDTVIVTPEGFAPTTASDRGDGTYSATIATFSAPAVTITLNGAPIQGSPFRP